MGTKLGAHVIQACEDLGDYIAAKPAIVKFVGDWGMAADLPPGVLAIGRKHQGSYDAQWQYTAGMSPRDAAAMFIADQLDTYQSNPYITYWEGHNEPVWDTDDEMSWFAQLEIERMRLMSALGLKCVIGNFATGRPHLELWPAFLPACQIAQDYDAILGLHEYSCPWMWWMTGHYQVDPDADEGDEGWTTLRYRKAYRRHLIPNSADIPLAITECGIDPMVNPQPEGCPGGTWKDLGSYWKRENGESDKADYYYRQLLWYDYELQKDDYVIGATIFTWGSFGPPWASFDIGGSDVSKKLVAYTLENPAADYPPDDYVPRGHPRCQYERTYVLLPPGADAAWARAVVDACWDEKRYTLGGSADDAGIGDLDVRRVIAVNPHEWPGPVSLEEFFAEHYPGVEYLIYVAETPDELRGILAHAQTR